MKGCKASYLVPRSSLSLIDSTSALSAFLLGTGFGSGSIFLACLQGVSSAALGCHRRRLCCLLPELPLVPYPKPRAFLEGDSHRQPAVLLLDAGVGGLLVPAADGLGVIYFLVEIGLCAA